MGVSKQECKFLKSKLVSRMSKNILLASRSPHRSRSISQRRNDGYNEVAIKESNTKKLRFSVKNIGVGLSFTTEKHLPNGLEMVCSNPKGAPAIRGKECKRAKHAMRS